MPKAIVLGAGMVGSVMACDLAGDRDMQVSIADIREANLDAASARAKRASLALTPIKADLSDPKAIKALIAPFDVVLGALSSKIGLSALRAVVDAGKNYADISFMGEDAVTPTKIPGEVGGEIDAIAKSRGATAVIDIGVAPGMSHLLAGHAAKVLSPCESIEIYVGGLPRDRRWPYEYKAGFSPADVIEEYTRPSRLVEHGRIVTRPALSEPQLLDFDGIGTLEAFNTDGLRSLVNTLRHRVPDMKEKTMRYPGHIELMRVFRETGLFSQDPLTLPGPDGKAQTIRPLDVISRLMFPKWTYEPGEEDLTVMRVTAVGMKDSRRTRLTWDLLDYYHRESQATSMSRTTAFPCTIIARMLASGKLRRPGVNVPELLADEPGLVDHVLAQLAAKGIMYQARISAES